MSHFQNVNIQDLLSGPGGPEGPGGEVVWSDAQKQEMNMRLAKARLQYRKTQMKAQRGGQGRYELRKRQLEMKNNHIAQSVDGVKPNNRLDAEQTTSVEPNYRAVIPSGPPDHSVSNTMSAKAKKNRAKREKKKKKKRQQAAAQNETLPQTIEVPGTGTDYDKIRLHLDETSAPLGEKEQPENEEDEKEKNLVLGGASAAMDGQISTAEKKK